MKKLLSIILAILMIVTSVPFAFAAEGDTDGTTIVITMEDIAYDGWNGNAIQVGFVSEGVFTKIADATIDDGSTATYETLISDGKVVAFRWTKENFPEECSFTISVDGETVFEKSNCSDFLNDEIFYVLCEHNFSDSVCSVCGYECGSDFKHNMTGNECSICGLICNHVYTNHYCKLCDDIEVGYYAGYLNDEIVWSLSAEGTLTISGTGYVENSNDYPWYNYMGTIVSVVIEEGIIGIGDAAFANIFGGSLSIPSTLEYIGKLNNCGTEIILADGNTHFCLVDGVLFNYDKTELVMYPVEKEGEEYTVPDGVTALADGAFSGVQYLRIVNISDDVTEIGDNCFDVSEIENIKFGANVEIINREAFMHSNIKTIIWPEKVTEMCINTFFACNNLENIIIGSNVKKIQDFALYSCDNLKRVHFLGTEEQWNEIKPQNPNDQLSTIEVHFGALEEKEGVDATCSEAGYTASLYCDECNAYITGEEIPATGEHTYVDGKCDSCGADCPHENITDGKCDDCGAEGKFITITMNDSCGDGWNGNAVVIERLIDGTYTEVATATIEDGGSGTFIAVLPKESVYALKWKEGEYPGECSFTAFADGEVIIEVTDGSAFSDGMVFYSCCNHSFENGLCTKCKLECGVNLVHCMKDGKCDICGFTCSHENYDDGRCTVCKKECSHSPGDQICAGCICTICGILYGEGDDTKHAWYYGECGYCGEPYPQDRPCTHIWNYNRSRCRLCGIYCSHETIVDNICTECNLVVMPFSLTTGETVTYHGSFPDALDNAQDGSVIKLLKDYDDYENIEIRKAITLDLNGKKWRQPSSGYWNVYANATFTDSVGGGYLDYSLHFYSPVTISGGSYGYLSIDFETENTLGDYLADCCSYFDTDTDELIDADDAKIVSYVTVKAGHDLGSQTCKGYQCKECGGYFGEADPDAHDIVIDEAVAPKCGETGLTQGEHCTRCDYKVEQEVVPALKHSFTKYEVTEEAKCGVEGKEVAACDRGCGATDEKAIEALRHSFTKYEVTEEAKCGVEGKEVAACDRGCGATDEKTIEALRHSFTKYEVTEEAKCGVEGKEVAACDRGCGATDEKAIEALRHSFTKYEETEAPKCGVAGKKVAACDNGCGATDEKAIAALTHKDADGDYKCDNGCGHEFQKPAPEEPTDKACDHLCHKGGFMGFIWKIVQFFWKLFKMNPVCECGAAHY